ncbi:DUF4493 domain-containing protein [Parabacteroides gordonii]|jgi:hypothetical protein|uniref:DUF4493 domain-containing protein n=1 Tax=Parabacteroides gordonii TaxID=574930 RepID=UPI00241E1CCF|nr:DUF4493 domain-containing protein [Parabacteroides gordonii]
MNKQYILLILSVLPLWLMLACSQENIDNNESQTDIPDGMGVIYFNMKAPTDVEIPTFMTRAMHHFDLDPNTFYLAIYEDGASTPYKTFASYNALVDSGLPLQLPVGKYQLLASSFEKKDQKVSKKPYFEGTTPFAVEEKRVSRADVTCKYASMAVELRLSEQFQNLLEDAPLAYAFEMDVYNGDGDTKWSFYQRQKDGEDLEKSLDTGYFLTGCTREDGKLQVKVRVRLDSSDWYPERVFYLPEEGTIPKVGEYYVINLDAGPEAKAVMLESFSMEGN